MNLNASVRARHGLAHILALGAALTLIAGCTTQPSETDYNEYQAALISVGDLRTDTSPADAPYTNEDLAINFSRVALRRELDIERPGSEENALLNPVQRWEGPIRYRIYGAGADPGDRAEIARFLDRISGLTGLETIPVERDVNMMILITAPEERESVSGALNRLNPALAEGFDTWRASDQVVCMATNLFSGPQSDEIVFGMIVLGTEVKGLLRRSCIHEEIAQSLGLGNDHPLVRPSIFNDDEEFALLTEHDEWLLRVLYDERLMTGMSEEEALPVVREILAEIRPEGEPGTAQLGVPRKTDG